MPSTVLNADQEMRAPLCVAILIVTISSEALAASSSKEHGSSHASKKAASLWGNTNQTLLSVYSALHDPVVGEVRVSLELFPDDLCDSIMSCTFPGSDVGEIQASTMQPWQKLLAPGEPEPRECFITCALPKAARAANLSTVALMDRLGNRPVTRAVERLEVPAQKKGVGICVAPVFTDTPQYLDWLEHHAAMGVEGIHLYVANVDSEHSKEMYNRGRPGHLKRVTLAQHHLVHFHEHYQIRYEIPTVYYSQKMLVTECVFRHRHVYDYIAVIDRDEFLYVAGLERREVDLAGMLHGHLDGTNFAAAAVFTARYPVRCVHSHIPVIGPTLAEVPKNLHTKPEDYQEYQGYDMWTPDERMPDFFNCSADWFSELWQPPGRQCHMKSIVRPLMLQAMNAHIVTHPAAGYVAVPKPFDPAVMFNKHLQCIYDNTGWVEDAPLCQRVDPVNYAEPAPHGVEVCPEDASSDNVWSQTLVTSS